MTQTINKFGVGSIAFAALMLLVLPLSFAKADDSGYYSADYSYPDTSSSYDYSYPDTTTSSSYDYSYPDQTSYATPSYSTGGYGTTGYSTGGYSTGGYMTGGGYSTPVYSTPSNIYAPTNTTVTDNTTTNTCTGNSCNTNITNPAPVINNNNVVANYSQPVAPNNNAFANYTQQYCQSGYSGTYPNCYINQQPIVYQQPPVAYNNTPYVSLTQVPYTGLDLGFWGSIAYWGAFVFFALFAAYLIAIKRVQNNIAAYLKSVLFGSEEEDTESLVPVTIDSAPAAPAPVVVATTNGDVIDSFIMSQINRARHA